MHGALQRRYFVPVTASANPAYCGIAQPLRAATSRVLRQALTKRPILLSTLDKIHEYILRPDTRAFTEQLRDPTVQRLFLLKRAGVHRADLDQDKIVAPSDASIRGAVTKVRSFVLPDGHKLVVLGDVERFAHRTLEAIEDRLPIGFGLSGAQ